jgi:hypothetical protein
MELIILRIIDTVFEQIPTLFLKEKCKNKEKYKIFQIESDKD